MKLIKIISQNRKVYEIVNYYVFIPLLMCFDDCRSWLAPDLGPGFSPMLITYENQVRVFHILFFHKIPHLRQKTVAWNIRLCSPEPRVHSNKNYWIQQASTRKWWTSCVCFSATMLTMGRRLSKRCRRVGCSTWTWVCLSTVYPSTIGCSVWLEVAEHIPAQFEAIYLDNLFR